MTVLKFIGCSFLLLFFFCFDVLTLIVFLCVTKNFKLNYCIACIHAWIFFTISQMICGDYFLAG